MIYYQVYANNYKSRLYILLVDALLDALRLPEFEVMQVAKGTKPKLMARKELK